MKNDLSGLDLVYPLRSIASPCEELLYSLRSACENMPHRSVCIVGLFLPAWINKAKVEQLPVGDPYCGKGLKARNTSNKLRKICEDDHISDPFILMNDDFFVLQKITDIPYYSWGEIYKHLKYLLGRNDAVSEYMRIMLGAAEFLSDNNYTTYDFGIHAPIIIDKATMLKVLDMGDEARYSRTLYGNMKGVQPVVVEDFKYNSLSQHIDFNRPFASTSNESFAHGVAGRDLRLKFNKPCRYEKGGK